MRLILSRSAAYFRSPGPQSHPNDRPSAKMLCFIIIYRKYKFKKNRCIPLPLAGEGKGIEDCVYEWQSNDDREVGIRMHSVFPFGNGKTE